MSATLQAGPICLSPGLYKLSVDQQKYNLAAVIGIFTFVVLSIVSLVTYRSSGSYKDEEGFK